MLSLPVLVDATETLRVLCQTGGRDVSITELAALSRQSPAVAAAHVGALERLGVLTRDGERLSILRPQQSQARHMAQLMV